MTNNLKALSVASGLIALLAGSSAAAFLISRYSNTTMYRVTLEDHSDSGEAIFTGQNVQFIRETDGTYSVDIDLEGQGAETQLVLQNIDLSLFIPTVPKTARGDSKLMRWFLSEREFNRQRVIFQPGSKHIDAPESLAGYKTEGLAIALTNNCLGAGYWELALYDEENDNSQKIYQGYFDFPRGAYSQLVESMNADTSYWQQARTMEAWIGFKFNKGLEFDLDRLRTVESEWISPADDMADSTVLSLNEQQRKESLIVNTSSLGNWMTYRELRQQPLHFQTFSPPGIYDPNQLWPSNFGEIERMISSTVRTISTPLSDKPLTEIELEFLSDDNQLRFLVVSGIDLDSVPQLSVNDYSEGLYRPLGFGVPFTQNYADLEQMRPEEDPFFSVLLDEQGTVMDYRGDVGINGLVMHRDESNPNRIHLYLMSYERIVLVGHYTIDLVAPNNS
ncbi:MAG: hypothetical protein AB4040_16750 [Synechococcus sp.]